MQFEETPSAIQILNAIRDTKSLNLFNAITLGDSKAVDMMIKLSISRKEFYLRISKLLQAGMIKCANGRYSITAFGSVIHEIHLALKGEIEYYSKLKNSEPSNSSWNELGKSSEQDMIIVNAMTG